MGRGKGPRWRLSLRNAVLRVVLRVGFRGR